MLDTREYDTFPCLALLYIQFVFPIISPPPPNNVIQLKLLLFCWVATPAIWWQTNPILCYKHTDSQWKCIVSRHCAGILHQICVGDNNEILHKSIWLDCPTCPCPQHYCLVFSNWGPSTATCVHLCISNSQRLTNLGSFHSKNAFNCTALKEWAGIKIWMKINLNHIFKIYWQKQKVSRNNINFNLYL